MFRDKGIEELVALKKIFNYLCDGEMEAANILYFLKSNYVQWRDMVVWLKRNNVRGKKLVQLFQNESPDGGGYHMGATYILSRTKGLKHEVRGIKIDELS